MFIKSICYANSVGSNEPEECYIETNDIYKFRRKTDSNITGKTIHYEGLLKSDPYHIYIIDNNIAEKLINNNF